VTESATVTESMLSRELTYLLAAAGFLFNSKVKRTSSAVTFLPSCHLARGLR